LQRGKEGHGAGLMVLCAPLAASNGEVFQLEIHVTPGHFRGFSQSATTVG
jgi:hypothetical protein